MLCCRPPSTDVSLSGKLSSKLTLLESNGREESSAPSNSEHVGPAHRMHDMVDQRPGKASARSRAMDNVDGSAESNCNVRPKRSTSRRSHGPSKPPIVVWFRGHDLRVHDHLALQAAVSTGSPIIALFVLEHVLASWTPPDPDYARAAANAAVAENPVPRYVESSSRSTHSAPVYDFTASDYSDQDEDDNTSHDADDERCRHSTSSASALRPLFRAAPVMGCVQRWYLHHSLEVLSAELAKLGIPLAVRAGHPAIVVPGFAASQGATSVYWTRRCKPRPRAVEDALTCALNQYDIEVHPFHGELLIEPHAVDSVYNDFHSFMAFWIQTILAHPPPLPKPPLTRADVKETVPFSSVPGRCISSLGLVDGIDVDGQGAPGDSSRVGCVSATQALSDFLQGERFTQFADPTVRRDGLLLGDHLTTSRLSPHVRFGEISPRLMFFAVVETGHRLASPLALTAARTFLKNMSLREFGYYTLHRYNDAAFKPIVPEYEAFPWASDPRGACVNAWRTGTTGFPIIDAAMRQLAQEGWIHNRMRFLVASFFCKYLLLPWHIGADYLVYALVDGDEACNSLGWQWTFGCNSDSLPSMHMINPAGTSSNGVRSIQHAAKYVRKYVPELSHLPDKYVFEPWLAPSDVQGTAGLFLLDREDYNTVVPNVPAYTNRTSLVSSRVYPQRIVQSREARIRAREAITVMRRIFQAHKIQRIVFDEFSFEQPQADSFAPSRSSEPAGRTNKTNTEVTAFLVEHEDVSFVSSDVVCADFHRQAGSRNSNFVRDTGDGMSRVASAMSKRPLGQDLVADRRLPVGGKRKNREKRSVPSRRSTLSNATELGSHVTESASAQPVRLLEKDLPAENSSPEVLSARHSAHAIATSNEAKSEAPKDVRRPPSPEVGILDRRERQSEGKRRRMPSTVRASCSSPTPTQSRVSVQSLLSPVLSHHEEADKRPPNVALYVANRNKPDVVDGQHQDSTSRTLETQNPSQGQYTCQAITSSRSVGGFFDGRSDVGCSNTVEPTYQLQPAVANPERPMFLRYRENHHVGASPHMSEDQRFVWSSEQTEVQGSKYSVEPVHGEVVPRPGRQSLHTPQTQATGTWREDYGITTSDGNNMQPVAESFNSGAGFIGGDRVALAGQVSDSAPHPVYYPPALNPSVVDTRSFSAASSFPAVDHGRHSAGAETMRPSNAFRNSAHGPHNSSVQRFMSTGAPDAPPRQGFSGEMVSASTCIPGLSMSMNRSDHPQHYEAWAGHHHQSRMTYVHPPAVQHPIPGGQPNVRMDMRHVTGPAYVLSVGPYNFVPPNRAHPFVQHDGFHVAPSNILPMTLSVGHAASNSQQGHHYGYAHELYSGMNSAPGQVYFSGNDQVGAPIAHVSPPRNSLPSRRSEREVIARKMAAMDYESGPNGGKYSEQWQAIALHLLKEYEFTDDTDRRTSKDYVRLCVLKDELRAHSRIRITVNHTKEFFRLLNLEVTGEWDRRGHGGVRGPYVYGIRPKSDRHVH